jgi:hypothetical protein
MQLIVQKRPVIAIKVLPGDDEAFFQAFCQEQQYVHLWLRPGVALALETGTFTSSFERRDHLLVPQEKAGAF